LYFLIRPGSRQEILSVITATVSAIPLYLVFLGIIG